MTDLPQLCSRIPSLCRLASRPEVRQALDILLSAPDGPRAPLLIAIGRYPEEAAHLTDLPPEDQLPLLALCRQCTAAELLSVLTRCTFSPTPEALSLLAADHRRQEAQRLYALQLLWRILGEREIPDALSLFGEKAPSRTGEDIRQEIITRLRKETIHDAHP